MDRDELQRLLIEHTDAWNSHDIDRLMSLFADDCVFEASAGSESCGRRFSGPAQVRTAFAAVFESMPDANWGDGRHFVISDDYGVSEWRLTGTLLDGKRVDVLGCDFLTVRDNKIVRKNSSESSDLYWLSRESPQSPEGMRLRVAQHPDAITAASASVPATPSAVDFPRVERFSPLDEPSTTGHSGRVADPAMKSGEHFVRRFWANKTQGSRALGGHLILTNQRLLFRPNKLDSATGGHSWECQLQTISNTAIAPRGHNPFDGSLRRRLAITTGSEVNYFVVWKVSKVISAIHSATAQ